MTKQQLILIVGGVCALAVLIGMVIVVLYFTRSNTVPSVPLDPFGNTVLPGGVSTVVQIPIRTSSGAVVSVPNFLQGHEAMELPNGKYYSIYGPEYSSEGFTFAITYAEPASEFLVTLLSEPIGVARSEAERYLKGMLTLTEEELCGLNIAVTVTPNINEAYSQYENLGLSFCSRAVKLP